MIKYLKQNTIYLLTTLLSLLSFNGAIIYRLYSLNIYGILASFALSSAFFIIIVYFHYKNNNEVKSESLKVKSDSFNKTLFTIYFLLFTGCIFILFRSTTSNSIISPWETIPYYFFLLYGATTLALFLILKKNEKHNLILISLHCLLSFSIALIIYKIGYGFDPFIHQATEKLIKERGSVDPKPFYYLGQYSLVILLNKILPASISLLDKLLVPVLSAILLPTAIKNFLDKKFENKRISNIILILILVLPFSFLIVTTPQNLAYLFLLLTIFYGLNCSNIIELINVFIYALSALLIHPIAGMPAIFFSLGIIIHHVDKQKIKKYLLLIIFILSSLALPAAFYFVENNQPNSVINQESVSQKTTITQDLKSWTNINFPNSQDVKLNSAYFFIFNIKIIILALLIGGLIIIYKNKKECKIFFINIIISLSLFVSYILTKNISFAYVINYEQNDFINRILTTAVIISFPIIILSLYWIVEKTLLQNKITKTILVIVATLLVVTSLYASYPRLDRYHNSKGYSVSQNDIDAVNWIENNTENDYIVLANQQVGAAALKEIGFNRYHKIPSSYEGEGQPVSPRLSRGGGEVELYFYPIPTSSPLYQYYLDMVYDKPSKEKIIEAMNLAGVNEAYFVLNKYWWAFDKIKEEAKLEADSWHEIDDGEIIIFQYTK